MIAQTDDKFWRKILPKELSIDLVADGFAGHASATANSQLTFHLDYSMGDDHA
jgi:hypothetical protein